MDLEGEKPVRTVVCYIFIFRKNFFTYFCLIKNVKTKKSEKKVFSFGGMGAKINRNYYVKKCSRTAWVMGWQDFGGKIFC